MGTHPFAVWPLPAHFELLSVKYRMSPQVWFLDIYGVHVEFVLPSAGGIAGQASATAFVRSCKARLCRVHHT